MESINPTPFIEKHARVIRILAIAACFAAGAVTFALLVLLSRLS